MVCGACKRIWFVSFHSTPCFLPERFGWSGTHELGPPGPLAGDTWFSTEPVNVLQILSFATS